MADLFSTAPRQPLAEALRPSTLNEVIGQTHLLGAGKPLRLAFEAGKAHSMILWGPPGVGKTTLARLMAHAFDSEFIALSAVFAGVKDIRATMDQAPYSLDQFGKHTLLFVDEIHQFNKAVNSYLKQALRRVIVQIFGLPHCLAGGNHG
ncbi:AAA family ATPase [Janthinobacterium sp. JC611]|uniref:AAA family ATPase n=1 Tax=Janthinobacterium sp. JC611 TaxID=2816201 RepID=UPI001BFE4629|nr:AAA family ATPase [Janthinobacterium sp. JC611]